MSINYLKHLSRPAIGTFLSDRKQIFLLVFSSILIACTSACGVPPAIQGEDIQKPETITIETSTALPPIAITVAPTSEPDAPLVQEEIEPTPTLIDPSQLPAVSPSVGGLAPDVTLPTLDQQVVQLSQLRGNYILVNYWASWCIPCMDELPALNRISQDYQSKNVVILTVNGITKDQMEDVTRTVQDLKLTLPILLDENETFWSNFQVHFLPTSFLIDNNGVIRGIILGSATEEKIRENLDLLIMGGKVGND